MCYFGLPGNDCTNVETSAEAVGCLQPISCDASKSGMQSFTGSAKLDIHIWSISRGTYIFWVEICVNISFLILKLFYKIKIKNNYLRASPVSLCDFG